MTKLCKTQLQQLSLIAFPCFPHWLVCTSTSSQCWSKTAETTCYLASRQKSLILHYIIDFSLLFSVISVAKIVQVQCIADNLKMCFFPTVKAVWQRYHKSIIALCPNEHENRRIKNCLFFLVKAQRVSILCNIAARSFFFSQHLNIWMWWKWRGGRWFVPWLCVFHSEAVSRPPLNVRTV